jgi:hypothetical protein
MLLPPDAAQTLTRVLALIRRTKEERKILSLTLRGLASLFGCPRGAIYLYDRAGNTLRKACGIDAEGTWDLATVRSFYFNEKPALPPCLIMAPVRAGDSVIGVLALEADAPIRAGAGRTATAVLSLLGEALARRREIAMLEAETSIARAALRGGRPADVIYRILHEIRRTVDYDHGASVLRREGDGARVVARQVAWSKGRSDIVGRRYPLAWDGLGLKVEGLTRAGGEVWAQISEVREASSPTKRSILLGPVADGSGAIGCVELSATRADFFVDMDAAILTRFLPYIRWCLIETAGGEP